MGFRPFFLAAALYAIVCVSTFVWALLMGDWPAASVLAPSAWHGHEMIYGFVLAAIAGFLLTAVPNWTATQPIAGRRLALLLLVWLAGRIAMAPGIEGSSGWRALIDLAFAPVLAAALAPALFRAKNRRNYAFLGLLALLLAGNLLFHNLQQTWVDWGPIDGLRLAINTVTLVVVVVAGRIVPAFTRNALARRGITHSIEPTPILDALGIAAVALVLLIDIVDKDGALAAGCAAAVAIVHLLRLIRWQGWKAADEPIVWVLHVGYAWLIVAFLLKALWIGVAAASAANWLHALTAGAFGTMIIGVMSRVALGHTGRPLAVRPSITVAYVMVSLGAAARVFGPALLPAHYAASVGLGALLWASAFLLFVIVYTPIMIRPRPA